MKVLAYPVFYEKDTSKFPTIFNIEGEKVLPIGSYPDMDEELLQIFTVATRQACQYILFKNHPVIRDERLWTNL